MWRGGLSAPPSGSASTRSRLAPLAALGAGRSARFAASGVAGDRVREVGRLEPINLVMTEVQIDRGDGVV